MKNATYKGSMIYNGQADFDDFDIYYAKIGDVIPGWAIPLEKRGYYASAKNGYAYCGPRKKDVEYYAEDKLRRVDWRDH